MLLAWMFFDLITVLETHYCYRPDSLPKRILSPWHPLVIGLTLFALLTCGGCRFWLSRMRKTGWALIPYLLGLMFTWFTAMYGVFVLPEYFLFCQGIAVVFFFAYFPFFVRFKQTAPPPLPSSEGRSTAARVAPDMGKGV
jgi:hypothetical protein